MSENVTFLSSELIFNPPVVLLKAGYRNPLVGWMPTNCLMPCWVMWYNPDPGCSCIACGRQYELTGQNILLIPPHTLYSGKYGGTPRHYYLWFKTASPFLTARREVVELPAASFAEKMKNAFQPGPRRILRLYALAEELLMSIPEDFFDCHAMQGADKLVHQALQFISSRNGITDNGEIAAELHISKTRFCHLFKSKMQIPPQKYCAQMKMYRARQLLLEGGSIESVADQCGYADRYHFSREFKRHHGASPVKWRKLHQD